MIAIVGVQVDADTTIGGANRTPRLLWAAAKPLSETAPRATFSNGLASGPGGRRRSGRQGLRGIGGERLVKRGQLAVGLRDLASVPQ